MPFCVGILRESEGQKAYCVHCFHCLISWFGSAFGSKTASPSFRTRMRFFSGLDDCCDGSLNRPNCQGLVSLLEPISPFLQRVQECHEIAVIGEIVFFETADRMEGCNAKFFAEPDGMDLRMRFRRINRKLLLLHCHPQYTDAQRFGNCRPPFARSACPFRSPTPHTIGQHHLSSRHECR